MRRTIKTIAAVAPLAVLGLAPALAGAAPAHESAGYVLADAGSAGGGDSHGHNNPNPYEQQQGRDLRQQDKGDSVLHIHVPKLPS